MLSHRHYAGKQWRYPAGYGDTEIIRNALEWAIKDFEYVNKPGLKLLGGDGHPYCCTPQALRDALAALDRLACA